MGPLLENLFIVRTMKMLHDFGKQDLVQCYGNDIVAEDIDNFFELLYIPYEIMLSLYPYTYNHYNEVNEVNKFYFSIPEMTEFYRLCREYNNVYRVKSAKNPFYRQSIQFCNNVFRGDYSYTAYYVMNTKSNHKCGSGVLFQYAEPEHDQRFLTCTVEILLRLEAFYKLAVLQIQPAIQYGQRLSAKEEFKDGQNRHDAA